MWIQYSDYTVPESTITIEDLFQGLSFDYISPYFKDKEEGIQFFRNEIGYKNISIADDKSELDMLYPLIDKMFSSKACSPKDIDMIILLQEKPTYNMGQHIQYQYGLKSPTILNISGNECASLEHSLFLANRILKSDPNVNNILIATSVIQPSFSDRMTYKFSLNGDAAGILLVGREEKKWQYDDALITNFNFNPVQNVDINKVIKHFEKLIQSLPSDILDRKYKTIFQNANVIVLHLLLERNGFDLKSIYNHSTKQYAHLYSLDLLIKMTDLINENEEETKRMFLVGTSSTGILSLTTLKTK